MTNIHNENRKKLNETKQLTSSNYKLSLSICMYSIVVN